jgi:hypothetical protein
MIKGLLCVAVGLAASSPAVAHKENSGFTHCIGAHGKGAVAIGKTDAERKTHCLKTAGNKWDEKNSVPAAPHGGAAETAPPAAHE